MATVQETRQGFEVASRKREAWTQKGGKLKTETTNVSASFDVKLARPRSLRRAGALLDASLALASYLAT